MKGRSKIIHGEDNLTQTEDYWGVLLLLVNRYCEPDSDRDAGVC